MVCLFCELEGGLYLIERPCSCVDGGFVLPGGSFDTVKRSLYCSASSAVNDMTFIVGPEADGRGVVERLSSTSNEADSKEVPRGVDTGGDNVVVDGEGEERPGAFKVAVFRGFEGAK